MLFMIYKPFIAKTRTQDTSLIITIPREVVDEHKVKDRTNYWFQLIKEVKIGEVKQRDTDIQGN